MWFNCIGTEIYVCICMAISFIQYTYLELGYVSSFVFWIIRILTILVYYIHIILNLSPPLLYALSSSWVNCVCSRRRQHILCYDSPWWGYSGGYLHVLYSHSTLAEEHSIGSASHGRDIGIFNHVPGKRYIVCKIYIPILYYTII